MAQKAVTHSLISRFGAAVAILAGTFGIVLMFRQVERLAFFSKSAAPIEFKNVDFGNAWSRSDFRWTVTAVNTSNEPITLSRIAAGCRCARIEPAQLRLEAGSAAQIALRIDLRVSPHHMTFGIARRFSLPVTCRSNGNESDFGFVLNGMVREPSKLSASEVFFDESDVDRNDRLRPKQLDFVTAIPCEVTAKSMPNGIVNVAVERRTERAGRLVITPLPKLSGDNFKCLIEMHFMAARAAELPTVSVPVSGPIIHDVIVRPDVLSFGVVPVGKTVSATVALSPRNDRGFAIVGATAFGSGLYVEPTKVDGLPRDVFKVRLKALAAGAQQRRVHFDIDCAGSRESIELPVSYFGHSSGGDK